MLLTVNGYNAWLVGKQSYWRRVMTRKATRRSYVGWGVFAITITVFSFVVMTVGDDEDLLTACLAAICLGVIAAMSFFAWESMKSAVALKPGPETKLFYAITTPIWDIVMVPKVVERADDSNVKRRIDDALVFWRRNLEGITGPDSDYRNFLHARSILASNVWQLIWHLHQLERDADASPQISQKCEELFRRQLADEILRVEDMLEDVDDEYTRLSDQWHELAKLRQSLYEKLSV